MCTYSFINAIIFHFCSTFSLITSGSLASSTLAFNPFFQTFAYFQYDFLFRVTCCEQVNFCSLYHKRRPIENCFGYRPPFFSEYLFNYIIEDQNNIIIIMILINCDIALQKIFRICSSFLVNTVDSVINDTCLCPNTIYLCIK